MAEVLFLCSMRIPYPVHDMRQHWNLVSLHRSVYPRESGVMSSLIAYIIGQISYCKDGYLNILGVVD